MVIKILKAFNSWIECVLPRYENYHTSFRLMDDPDSGSVWVSHYGNGKFNYSDTIDVATMSTWSGEITCKEDYLWQIVEAVNSKGYFPDEIEISTECKYVTSIKLDGKEVKPSTMKLKLR